MDTVLTSYLVFQNLKNKMADLENETNGISHERHQISTKFGCRQTYGEVDSNIFGLGDLENMGFAAGIFPISLFIAELKLLPVYVVAISISGVRRHAPILAVAVSV